MADCRTLDAGRYLCKLSAKSYCVLAIFSVNIKSADNDLGRTRSVTYHRYCDPNRIEEQDKEVANKIYNELKALSSTIGVLEDERIGRNKNNGKSMTNHHEC